MFIFIGTFVEELVSPIPSFLVLIPSGAAAEARHAGIAYLLFLMVLSACGRIIAALILYWLANKFEAKLLANGRRFFGVSHTEVERVGQKLGKKRKRDWIILFLMNAIPIFPTAALSVTCGFLKVRMRLFIFCTFFGTMINSLIYMLIGYGGFKAATALNGLELASQIVLGIILIAGVIWLARVRRRRTKTRN